MNSIALLLALLAVAYFGSTIASAGGGQQRSLVHLAQYVLLGVAVGPRALGLVNEDALGAFAPLAAVAIGWMAMEAGFRCGTLGPERVTIRRFAQGLLLSAAISILVAALVGGLCRRFGWLSGRALWVASLGMGLVSAASTRHALRWRMDGRVADGPLYRLIAGVASADAAWMFPVLGVLFCVGADSTTPLHHTVPPWAFCALTLLLGALLGGCVVALFTMPLRHAEAWGVLFGAALLGVGLSSGIGAAWPTTLFATGITLSLFVSDRVRLRARFERAERAVALPAVVLAGSHLDVPGAPWFFVLVLFALAGHTLIVTLLGWLLWRFASPARQGSPWLGPALLASGPLPLTIGFACALRFDDVAGQLILAAAVSETLLGEVVGPLTLRQQLRRAGEYVGLARLPGSQVSERS